MTLNSRSQHSRKVWSVQAAVTRGGSLSCWGSLPGLLPLILLFVFLIFEGTSLLRAEPPDGRRPQEWRVLLVVKPQTKVTVAGNPTIDTKLSDDNIAAVRLAFTRHTPAFVSELTEGRVVWQPDVVISPRAVTSVTAMGNNAFWLSPADVKEDLQQFAPLGKYDGVLCYWKAVNDDGRGLNVGFGWTIGPNPAANFAGFSSVHYAATSRWGADSEITEVFLHEWQHQLEAFYSEKGVRLPKGGLHVDASYGYRHHPTRFWKPWYRDFLTGNVREPDGTRSGLGDKAWALGTIRSDQLVYLPDYLTPERRRRNLLRDGSFESSGQSPWTADSWRRNKTAARVVSLANAREGQRVAQLSTGQPDDAHFRQTVAVKPGTRYLFAGWVRTAEVAVEENGTTGANLSVLGGFERSRKSLQGSRDWTYLSLVFESGERTSVDVAIRLGHHGSTATGNAWFDDLCLLELGRIAR